MGVKWLGKEKGLLGIDGIPGKDLTDEELERRGLDKKSLIETGLYEDDAPKKPKRVKKVKADRKDKEANKWQE